MFAEKKKVGVSTILLTMSMIILPPLILFKVANVTAFEGRERENTTDGMLTRIDLGLFHSICKQVLVCLLPI